MLAVYNSCTPGGSAGMVYLHSDMSDLHVYTLTQVYALCVNHSSGAYYGSTVYTVEGFVAAEYRGFRVNKYW